MRIPLDENIPVQLKAKLRGHLVKSVNDSDVGWKNIQNGRLLAEREGKFDLLITADRYMFAQQNLSGRDMCILVLPVNRRNDVLALSERIIEVAAGLSAGSYVELGKQQWLGCGPPIGLMTHWETAHAAGLRDSPTGGYWRSQNGRAGGAAISSTVC